MINSEDSGSMDSQSVTHECSFSPRQNHKYLEDKATSKDMQRLINKGDTQQFMSLLYTEILRVKPDVILDFILDDFLADNGAANQLKKK